jgi:CBS domain-containing protein
MRAGELCVRDVVTALPDETVIDAARRMAGLHVGDVVVVDDATPGLPRPIGIVTDRDLVVGVLARPERVPTSTKLAEVMRRDLVVAKEDDTVESVVAIMREHAIRRIPIVDRDGRLQGVLSLDDVLGWMRDQIQAATKLVERQGAGPLQRR